MTKEKAKGCREVDNRYAPGVRVSMVAILQRRIALGGLLLLPFITACGLNEDTSQASLRAGKSSLVIKYYPAFDSDLVADVRQRPEFVGGVVIEITPDTTLRWCDTEDLTRIKERQLDKSEYDQLAKHIRQAMDALGDPSARPGVVIDFSRVCIVLSNGLEERDCSFNMNIKEFLSESPLNGFHREGRGLREELERLRTAVVNLIERK